jgi:hypothetical protein
MIFTSILDFIVSSIISFSMHLVLFITRGKFTEKGYYYKNQNIENQTKRKNIKKIPKHQNIKKCIFSSSLLLLQSERQKCLFSSSLLRKKKTFDVLIFPMASKKIRTSKIEISTTYGVLPMVTKACGGLG